MRNATNATKIAKCIKCEKELTEEQFIVLSDIVYLNGGKATNLLRMLNQSGKCKDDKEHVFDFYKEYLSNSTLSARDVINTKLLEKDVFDKLTDSQTKLNNLKIELETVEQKIKILESDYDVTKTNLSQVSEKFTNVSKTNHVELFT